MKMHKLDKTIKKYKNSFNPFYFNVTLQIKINDNTNPAYYHNTINNWLDTRSSELVDNITLKGRANLLNDYLKNLRWLMICTVELYEAIERYDGTVRVVINRINIKEFEVLETLKSIKDYKISINLNKEKGNDELAKRLENYCLNKLNECIIILERQFFIRLYDSPLVKQFEVVANEFRKSHSEDKNSIKNYKETIWFKVGLLFANGEIETLKTTFNNNCTQFAKSKFGENANSYRVYISESFSENAESKKNIFNSPDKVKKIYNYCVEENIVIIESFKNKYNSIK